MTSPKKVVILGALSAIAEATARLYAAEKATLLLVARQPERLAQLAADLAARGASRVETEAMDLDAEGVNAAAHLARWKELLGGLDHVLVIYGYLGEQPKALSDASELARILSVNFTSAAHWSVATGELLKAQDKGALVVVGSVAGDRGRQSNYAYGAAKGGVGLLVQGIAHDLAKGKARAAVVKPGFVDTPMTAAFEKKGALWAKPAQIAVAIRRAANGGGPIQYAPGLWKMIMLVIRTVPSFVFHKTKL